MTSPLFRYCLMLTRHVQDAEDLAQEVEIAMWQKGLPESLAPIVAKRMSIDRLRTQTNRFRLVQFAPIWTAGEVRDERFQPDLALERQEAMRKAIEFGEMVIDRLPRFKAAKTSAPIRTSWQVHYIRRRLQKGLPC